jgi:hypothetical protein
VASHVFALPDQVLDVPDVAGAPTGPDGQSTRRRARSRTSRLLRAVGAWVLEALQAYGLSMYASMEYMEISAARRSTASPQQPRPGTADGVDNSAGPAHGRGHRGRA